MNGLYFAPVSGKASSLPIEGSVMLDPEMRTWAQARGMHLFYNNNFWHVMIGKTWCTTGYEIPQKALEACWESGEYEDIAKCVALKGGMATLQQVVEPARHIWFQLLDLDNGSGWVEVCKKYDPHQPEHSELHSSVDWSDAAQVRDLTALYTHPPQSLTEALAAQGIKLRTEFEPKPRDTTTQPAEPPVKQPLSTERVALIARWRGQNSNDEAHALLEEAADMLEADAQELDRTRKMYEQAVQGRSDFRQALRKVRGAQKVAVQEVYTLNAKQVQQLANMPLEFIGSGDRYDTRYCYVCDAHAPAEDDHELQKQTFVHEKTCPIGAANTWLCTLTPQGDKT